MDINGTQEVAHKMCNNNIFMEIGIWITYASGLSLFLKRASFIKFLFFHCPHYLLHGTSTAFFFLCVIFWNFQVSISSTFYLHLFHTKPFAHLF